jgi:hypothetical protein
VPELNDGAAPALAKRAKARFLTASIEEVTFQSGITLYDVDERGNESEVPSPGTPHWGAGTKLHPAVYVREGGTGETRDVKVKVAWSQKGFDGAAKLRGESTDGAIRVEGDLNVSGEKGGSTVTCSMAKKPAVVKNYGRSVGLRWRIEAGGSAHVVSGGSPVRLFFVDAKPKPVGWLDDPYKAHYLRVVDWATAWAEGKHGSADVFKALWSRFSDGKGAMVPHATGLSYWKTDDPVQNLKDVVKSGRADARRKGWSCRAIAHVFMESLAVNGIQSVEVIPAKPAGTALFLVKNWRKRATPIPNWPSQPDWYYGGSWVPSKRPPLSKGVPTSLGLVIDLQKEPGVPAQGQSEPPMGFANHWIVLAAGKLWDTSYGTESPNDIGQYAERGLAGWLIGALEDSYPLVGGGKKRTRKSRAWICHELSKHALLRLDRSRN